MNNEKKEQFIVIIKMIVIIICASLYAWGGMEYKFLRRFVAPFVAGVTIFAFSRDWKSLIKIPLLIGASTMGYGAEEFWVKILKRAKVGFCFAIATNGYEIYKVIRGEFLDRFMWVYVIWSSLVIISAFICLGVFNPFNNARIEESILGLVIYSMAIMPVQRRVK